MSDRAVPLGLQVPEGLRGEHEELFRASRQVAQEKGAVGRAARLVADLLEPHLRKEEEYALPPLGLLTQVSTGRITDEMKAAVALAERLKSDLPELLEEHVAIAAAGRRLREAALEAGHEPALRLVERLAVHAQEEEEILYPASLLVGEYLKCKLRL